MWKIIVAHPMQQHSFRLATALKRAGLLERYYTTVFLHEKDLFWRIANKITKNKFKKTIFRKKCAIIDSDAEVLMGISGIVLSVLAKWNYNLSCRYYVHITNRFGIKVAKRAIRANADAVVMYDYTAAVCFQYLKRKAPNILRILDVSSIPVMEIKRILDEETERGYGKYYTNKKIRYSDAICRSFAKEVTDADALLVPSQYVENAVVRCGSRREQCFKAPYGVDTASFCRKSTAPEVGSPFRFIYTGRIEAAKGIFYVLDGLKDLWDDGYRFEFHLCGNLCVSEEDILPYRHFMVIHGFVQKDDLVLLYNSSHVFIMDSLWEGMSLSTIEALSCGLPCIVSESSGMGEYIHDGKNGFVIPPADPQAVYEKAKWFLDNRNNLGDLSNNAMQSVKTFDWDHYEHYVIECIKTIMNQRRV